MINVLQKGFLMISGYIIILVITGALFLITNFRRWYKKEDSTTMDIKEWKEIQVRNRELKKEKEILEIENLRLERLNKDIIEEIKYQNQ